MSVFNVFIPTGYQPNCIRSLRIVIWNRHTTTSHKDIVDCGHLDLEHRVVRVHNLKHFSDKLSFSKIFCWFNHQQYGNIQNWTSILGTYQNNSWKSYPSQDLLQRHGCQSAVLRAHQEILLPRPVRCIRRGVVALGTLYARAQIAWLFSPLYTILMVATQSSIKTAQ